MTFDNLESQRLFRCAFWKRNYYLFCALSLGLSYLTVLACLRVRVNGEVIEIDSRPSDAIALSVHFDPVLPIYVEDSVLGEVA